jgi:hypothetical protein
MKYSLASFIEIRVNLVDDLNPGAVLNLQIIVFAKG